jgi:RimJ/RimL family protein N-acetyltransferase
LSDGDRGFILQAWTDERVHALVQETMSEQQVRERIERWGRHRATYGFGPEIFADSSGQAVGWGGLQHSVIGIGDRLTIGYAIAPDRWGRGYATEIALASLAYAFDNDIADEVRASILSTNNPSRSVAEKAGLTRECEVPHGEHIEVIYLITREAWRRRSDSSSVCR